MRLNVGLPGGGWGGRRCQSHWTIYRLDASLNFGSREEPREAQLSLSSALGDVPRLRACRGRTRALKPIYRHSRHKRVIIASSGKKARDGLHAAFASSSLGRPASSSHLEILFEHDLVEELDLGACFLVELRAHF